MSLRRRVYEILNGTASESRLDTVASSFLFLLIVVNIVAVLVASVPSVLQRWESFFWRLEVFSVTVFSIEYVLRVWSAPENLSGKYAGRAGRLRFMLSPMAIVDLLAIVPFYAALFVPAYDLRFLRALRLIRMLKLIRYSTSMDLFASVLRQERNSLITAIVIMMVVLLLASSLMYLVEGHYQPEAFGSIPQAMWWGMVTLTTLGYGDVVPQTVVGKALGMVIALVGVGTFALPTGILASGFMEQLRRRDFLTTWRIVASYPPFRGLDAVQVAQIMDITQTRILQRNELLFRKGELAAGMFFIITGQVEVSADGRDRTRLSAGSFVGELGLLRKSRRSQTVKGAARSVLMFLEREELKALMDSHSDIGEILRTPVRVRLAELGADSL